MSCLIHKHLIAVDRNHNFVLFLVFNVWVSWSTIGVYLFVFLVTNRLGIEWLAWLDLTWELDKNKRVLHDMSNNNSFFNNTVKRYLSIESTSFSGPGLCAGRQQYNSPVFNETFGCFLLYFCSLHFVYKWNTVWRKCIK